MTVRVEVLSWVNKLVGGPGTGEVTVEAPAPRGARPGRPPGHFRPVPELGRALWDPTRPHELGDNIEVLVNNAVLGLTHDLDGEVLDGERLTHLRPVHGG